MGIDPDFRWDVQNRLAVTHVPREISCAFPKRANMTCCVRPKQQTYEYVFPVLLLLQQSQIALHLSILLYLSPLLMLVENT